MQANLCGIVIFLRIWCLAIPMNLSALRTRRFMRFASLLALWAMLLPALVALVHRPVRVASFNAPICHVALSGDYQQAPQSDKTKSSCPICWGLNNLAQGFVAPELQGLVHYESVVLAAVTALQQTTSFTLPTASWPRAPPVLA